MTVSEHAFVMMMMMMTRYFWLSYRFHLEVFLSCCNAVSRNEIDWFSNFQRGRKVDSVEGVPPGIEVFLTRYPVFVLQRLI